MKNLKSIITIIAICFATTFSATEKEKRKSTSKTTTNLRTELVSMLGNKIEIELKNTTYAEVSFMVNNRNEIVIVAVDSKVNKFNSFVKNKLNYKKINVKGVKKGEIYRLPIKFKVE